MKIRQPAVAGRFYPSTAGELEVQLSEILRHEKPFIDYSLSEKNIIGGVVPHAGYMYSARQAVHFFEILKSSGDQFDTFFIINPNHTGHGAEIALDDNDYWETPFGKTEIDRDFYPHLGFSESSPAHKYEHSGEVMLPFLQYFNDYPFRIVPVTMSKQNPQNARMIAEAVMKANKQLQRKICLIASSDFSHFVQPQEGNRLDKFVLDEIAGFNPEGIYRQVREKQISVCGFGPIMTLIEYARLKAASPQMKILKAGNSGDVIPSDEVVDYVSILFYTETWQVCESKAD
jgi:AmmeMemoRadiSam system protein B